MIEIVAEIDRQNAPMVELNVLCSPGKEEFTRIVFYKERRYVDWERSGGWARFRDSKDSLLVIDTTYTSELPDVESRAPEMAPIYLARGEPLKLRIFIDQSVVEVFTNERQCVAVRVYLGHPDSTGISLRAQGAEALLHSLDLWQMRSIYDGSAI